MDTITVLGIVWSLGFCYFVPGTFNRDGGSFSWDTLGSFIWFIWFPAKALWEEVDDE